MGLTKLLFIPHFFIWDMAAAVWLFIVRVHR